MQVSIEQRPSNTIARCTFDQGDSLTAEGGSMVAMSGGLNMETTTHKRGSGSVKKALKRIFAGESFFLNHYTAQAPGAQVILSATLSGDIQEESLNGRTIMIQGNSYMAHYGEVDIDASWQGFKNIFSGESFFWVKASGQGTVIYNAFGVIYPIDVDGEVIVDTGHVVAFEDQLEYKVTKVGRSWITSFLGGEGMVLKFSGKGRVWCQSHNPVSFGRALGPMLWPR